MICAIFGFSQNADDVLRIDFYRCGNHNVDSIKIKEIFIQNNNSIGSWSAVDDFDYGEYRIEAINSKGECIFRKGYSSLFCEWKETAEANQKDMEFEESVVIPYSKDIAKVVFYIRDSLNFWEQQKSIDINLSNYKRKSLKKYPVENLSICGKAEEKLDILFLPDGYTKKELPKFKEDCQNAMNWILAASPFDEFKDKINFRAVMAPSVDSGPDFPHKGIIKNTVLNSSFNTFGIERYLTTLTYHAVMDLASNSYADHVIILINTNEYGGGGFYNFFTLSASRNSYSNYLVQHELGHGLCGLGDEYYTSDVAVEDFYNFNVEPWEPNLTTLVDFSSKWDSLLEKGTAIPTPVNKENCKKIGVFEGGGYSAKGVFRPACECTMKSVRYNDFCEVCKVSTRKIIRWYSR